MLRMSGFYLIGFSFDSSNSETWSLAAKSLLPLSALSSPGLKLLDKGCYLLGPGPAGLTPPGPHPSWAAAPPKGCIGTALCCGSLEFDSEE